MEKFNGMGKQYSTYMINKLSSSGFNEGKKIMKTVALYT
jgi:hypothetical protein